MLKEFVDKIPNSSRIAIFGTSQNGDTIKDFIDTNRPDLKINFFIDSFKTGSHQGINIISLKELQENKSLIDYAIITTRNFVHDIMEVFNYLDIPYIIITRGLEQNIKATDYVEKFNEAIKIFETQSDKDLYKQLWNAYSGVTHYEKIEEYVKEKYNISTLGPRRNYQAQYLDFIDKDAIKTVVDAGFCNGIHSLAFKKQFKNIKTLYALEPMYEKFKNENYDYYIQKANFVKIIPMGLWDECKEIEFLENTAQKSASRIKGTKGVEETKVTERATKIQTTTIDEIKKSYNIEKIDFIKMDIEGAELPALKGGENSIIKDRPQLAISIYHSMDDFVSIPLYLKRILQNYKFHIGHYSYNHCETVLYAIPNELINKDK